MKEMLLFEFPKESSGHAVTYDLIKKFDLKINIIRASIDFNAYGFLLVEIEGSEAQVADGIQYLRESHVNVKVVDAGIMIDKDKCLDCGACCAVCAVDALYLDDKDSLYFDKDKCLDCKLCVMACPARAIESVL